MASEWIGVVGVVIGGGLTGAFTLLHGRVQSRNEASARREAAALADRHRAEDWDRTLRQQNVESRRDLYIDLYAAASALTGSLVSERLKLLTGASDADELASLGLPDYRTALKHFDEVTARVAMTAVDPEVVGLTSLIRQEATEQHAEVAGEKRDKDNGGPSLWELLWALRSACRADLGFVDPAPGGSAEA